MRVFFVLLSVLVFTSPGVLAGQPDHAAESIDWSTVHFDTLGHHRPWFEQAVDYLSNQPDSVFLHLQAEGDYLGCVVSMLAMAAKHQRDLEQAWEALPPDHPA